MAAKLYYQEDCNLSVLEGQTIAIIGYGSQGHALYPSDYLHTGSDIYIISDDGGSRSLTIRQCIRSDRHLLKNHAIFTDNRPLRNKNSK